MVNRDMLLVALIVLFTGGVLVYSLLSYAGSTLLSGTDVSLSSSESIPQGDVTIDVQLLSQENNQISFSIALNTHSVDLSQFDLQELVTLEYGGTVIEPLSVPRLSGHHASGTIRFTMPNEAKAVLVRVRGVPQEMEREFRFS